MTGTMAEAKKDKSEGNDNNPFKALWDGIENIELTPGPQGETGATGEQGETGSTADITIYQRAVSTAGVPIGEIETVTALCDTGDVATGGGINTVGDFKVIDSFQENADSVNSPSWTTSAQNVGTNPNDFFYSIVLCLDKTP